MQTKTYDTIVVMPNEMKLEVRYYCTDKRLDVKEKEKLTQLFIQLDDCICTMKIEKSITRKVTALEAIVQNKVLHERGHLC